MGNLHGQPGVSRRRRLVTSIGLCLLFLVVYGGTNWFTEQRSDVGTWCYAWEKWIPFVPLMIIPYMSIDLFFIAAPFLCRDRLELRILSKRIAIGIVVAGICFLLFPLKLTSERQVVDGWLGVIFNNFCEMDQPYNLLPSLHITLRTLLAVFYVSKTVGLLRIGVHIWFSLIGLSTLLTYQHHVVDLVGGYILGTCCLYLISDVAPAQEATKNLRIAFYYALGVVGLAMLAVAAWPLGALLLWPAFGLAITSAGYCGLGPSIFRKSAGTISWNARLLLGPVLLGHYLSLLYYRRRSHAWDEVTPRVWVGRQLTGAEATKAIQAGVTAVLDMTAEFSETAALRALTYRNVPVLDLTAPTLRQMQEAVAFINAETAQSIVFVHCKAGYSRSAAVVGAYLIANGHTAVSAAECLRKARPGIVIRPEAMEALSQFEAANTSAEQQAAA